MIDDVQTDSGERFTKFYKYSKERKKDSVANSI